MKFDICEKRFRLGIFLFLSALVVMGSFFWLLQITRADRWKEWRTYRNPSLGFSFRYPEHFGDIVVEEGENAETGEGRLKGEWWSLRFSNENTQVYLSARTPDWEPWEHQIITWKSHEDANAYCASFSGYWFVLFHNACKAPRDGVSMMNYVNYAPEGIASDPNTMLYERAAFVKLHNPKFMGLEVRMILDEQVDLAFSEKTTEDIRTMASVHLMSLEQSRKNDIAQFDRLITSFALQ